ncbi:adventurous gliding motility protein AgmC [Archangium sp.]|uniref:adventurous gliding motility protein AgmC n=1 Tax=Archangium sp. TaxID=1872627 RepID=UPI00286BB2F4|nr:hemagglutinin [Archangium sp.]
MSHLAPTHVVTASFPREDLGAPWRPGPLLGLLAMVLALAPVTALAEGDVFGLGNAQHGNLTVRDPGLVINASSPLSAEALAGSSELRVADVSAFAAGELVLVLQMGSDTALPGAQETEAAVSLTDSGAGRWELARLASVEPGVLRLTAPLVRRFASESQVVRVPEYDAVRLNTSAALVAPPWNGRNGGVLAFLATGTVFNSGSLVADGVGFRGGTAQTGTSAQMGCEALNGPVGGGGASGGGANKGEGIASASAGAATSGYGRLGNGGGGGNCHDAGGGGGALGGRGGRGGNSAQEDGSRPVGGHGGAALGFEPRERLLLGGGGGAGHEGSAGGTGGGIIFIRAHEVQGPKPRGFITANGGTPLASSTGGAGGGGAGGSIHVRVERRLGCTLLEARGRAGGNSDISPGGGAGGGQLYLQGQGGVDSACAVSASAGLAGTTSTGSSSGAEPVAGSEAAFTGSTVVIDQGFVVPTVPTWVSPGAGEVVSPLSPLEGKTAPGASVQVFIDGVPVGAPVVADATGSFSVVTPAEIPRGPHEARAWAEQLGARSALSAPLGFNVGDLQLRVGFGCGSAPAAEGGLGAFALALALLVCVPGRGKLRGNPGP